MLFRSITCQLTTVQGCNLTLSATLHSTVMSPSFTTSGTPCFNSVHFTNTSTIQYGNFASWSWNFGDGTPTDTNQNPIHAYATHGLYYVTLHTYSLGGCVDSVTQPVMVYIPPVADFSSNVVCRGNATAFTDLSTSVFGPVTNWSWNFGDMTVSNAQNPQHIYSTAGNFIASLIVTNAAGCSDTIVHTVMVSPIPTIVVSPVSASLCTGQSISLFAAGASSYTWSPSTGLSSTSGSPVTAQPSASTIYSVTGTLNGCTASALIPVNVYPIPSVSVSPNATICSGQNTILNASGATSYSWSPSTGLSSTWGNSVSANPPSTTTYTVIGTQNGCSSAAMVTVTVNPAPLVAVSPGTTICAGQSTTLIATGANSFSWSPSASLSSATGNSVSANPSSTTIYTVTGIQNGCTASAQVTVAVNPLPVVSVTSASATLCAGQSTQLNAYGAGSYLWSPSTGLSSVMGNSVSANPLSTTTYMVVGSLNGCTASSQITITVYPYPVVLVSPDTTICSGQSMTLTANGANTYSWSPSLTLSSSTGNPVIAVPPSTTTYTVTGDQNGCTATAQVTVSVNPLPVVSAYSMNTILCNGQSTVLNATGANSYTWSPLTALSSATGNSVTANPS